MNLRIAVYFGETGRLFPGSASAEISVRLVGNRRSACTEMVVGFDRPIHMQGWASLIRRCTIDGDIARRRHDSMAHPASVRSSGRLKAGALEVVHALREHAPILSVSHDGRRFERSFRPDVEGLRAIAVLLVVLDHAGVQVTRGGYVGVDVFFVLSGFLITGLLLRE